MMRPGNPFLPADVLARARLGVATFERGRSYPRVRCVVRSCEIKTTKAGKPYLSLKLGDRTGEADAKSFDGAELAPTLATGTVVEIERLDVDDFGLKFDALALKVSAPGTFDAAEFVPTLPEEVIEENWKRLHENLDSMEHPHLLQLREAVFGEPEVQARYKTHPSGIHHHHDYIGGNVEHVVGIQRVVDAVCRSYPEIDRDLVLFGAAVHDLGKLREYEVTTTIGVTDEGRLKGHVVIGAEWIGQIIHRMRKEGKGFPKGVEDHLVHMILSHHCKGEWGSPKPPATPEAMLLHLGDYVDSQTKGFLQDVERNVDAPDGWAKRFDPDAGRSQWFKTRRDWV